MLVDHISELMSLDLCLASLYVVFDFRMGVFFSPLIPLMCVAKCFILFYVKKVKDFNLLQYVYMYSFSMKNTCVCETLCPQRQQSLKKLFLAQRSK